MFEEHLWEEPGGGQNSNLLSHFGQTPSQPLYSYGKDSARSYISLVSCQGLAHRKSSVNFGTHCVLVLGQELAAED